jgi:hypothetical protein
MPLCVPGCKAQQKDAGGQKLVDYRSHLFHFEIGGFFAQKRSSSYLSMTVYHMKYPPRGVCLSFSPNIPFSFGAGLAKIRAFL